ncbi:hypothetical protein ACFO5X_20835, partial [Seohaeicola nanhaiensis]
LWDKSARGKGKLGVQPVCATEPLYMVHALVEKAGFTIAERVLGTDLMPLWVLPVILLAAIGAAAILYHMIEEPGRRALIKPAAGRL